MITSRDKEKKPGALIKELDTLVSLFVRMSAADEHGAVRCVSCKERLFWKDAHCAHYKDRDNMATRYHLPNLATACAGCNVYNHYEHIRLWTARLTPEEQSSLELKSKSMEKFTRYELKEMIEDYKLKVAELRRTKHL